MNPSNNVYSMFFSKNSPQRWFLQILIHIISRSCSIILSIPSFPFIHIISIFIYIISISSQEMIFKWKWYSYGYLPIHIISIWISFPYSSISFPDQIWIIMEHDLEMIWMNIISISFLKITEITHLAPFPRCFFRRIVPQTRRASSSSGAKLRSGHLFGEQLEFLAMKPWVGWFTYYPLVMST